LWELEHEQIRQKVISILTNEPVLTIFDPQFSIELHTDASSVGYGAILLHRIEASVQLSNILARRHLQQNRVTIHMNWRHLLSTIL